MSKIIGILKRHGLLPKLPSPEEPPKAQKRNTNKVPIASNPMQGMKGECALPIAFLLHSYRPVGGTTFFLNVSNGAAQRC